MKTSKLAILVREYCTIRVLTGSSLLFFFVFWTTKCIGFLRRLHPGLRDSIDALVRIFPACTFILQNKSGIFEVTAFDDSMTICSDYFEHDIRDWIGEATVKDCFIDIGANRGIYTVLAHKIYKFSTVHAFEPNPEVYETLCTNIKLNGMEKLAKTHNIGLGSKTAEVPFVVDRMHKGGGRIVPETNRKDIRILIKPLDTVLPVHLRPQIGFVKIDTEGYEAEVLNGMHETLTAMPTGACIMIETTGLSAIQQLLAPHKFTHQASNAHDHLFRKYA